MTTYWLSFRIGDKGNYESRYEALLANLNRCKRGKYWEETTSFVVFTSNLDIDQISSTLSEGLKPDWDLILVREMDKQSARVWGNNDDDDIFELMPYLKYA